MSWFPPEILIGDSWYHDTTLWNVFPSSDLVVLSGLSVSCSASCCPVCAGHSVRASFVAGLSRFPEGTVTVNKAFSSVVDWVPGQRPQPL